MSLLLYSDITQKVNKKLKDVIETQVTNNEIEIYHDINSLSNRFYQPQSNLSIMLLVAAKQNDLFDFISIKHLFFNMPIILILPDRDNETISKGLKLTPRFFDYIDSDFSDIALVLKKMMRKFRIE